MRHGFILQLFTVLPQQASRAIQYNHVVINGSAGQSLYSPYDDSFNNEFIVDTNDYDT
jgi:hypothetical protein